MRKIDFVQFPLEFRGSKMRNSFEGGAS